MRTLFYPTHAKFTCDSSPMEYKKVAIKLAVLQNKQSMEMVIFGSTCRLPFGPACLSGSRGRFVAKQPHIFSWPTIKHL